jgi:hypothetical protein
MAVESPEVYNLHRGEVVTCVEIVGRRARIIDPVEGWVSLTTVHNETIMGLTVPPDKKTQIRAMNRRFDTLKQEHALKRGASSPVAAPAIQRTGQLTPHHSPISPKSGTPVESLKKKIVFKSSIEEAGIPKALAGPPNSCQTTSPLPPVVNLIDFDSPMIGELTTPNEITPQETPNNIEKFSLI